MAVNDESPAYPSLDTRGLIRGMKQKAMALLDSYFTSNASQSNLYNGAVKSITKDIQVSGYNERSLKERVTGSLNILYSRYFEAVDLTVRVVDADEEDGKVTIEVAMTLTNPDGATMNLAAVAETAYGKRWQTQWETQV